MPTQMLMPNHEELVINSPAAVPADGTNSPVYAVPHRTRLLALSIRPVGTYATLSVSLFVSNHPTDGFALLKNSTSTSGEFSVSSPLAVKFCRVTVVSSTGASRTGMVIGVTAK